jgi:hypothetical protein
LSRSTEDPVPALAPADDTVREIQAVLDLVRPVAAEEPEPRYVGYSVAAAEAYLHLAREANGGRPLRVLRHGNGPDSRWWLADERGRVIDLALSPADRRRVRAEPLSRYPYEEGRGAMFRTGPEKPSKRAAALIELVRARR